VAYMCDPNCLFRLENSVESSWCVKVPR